MHPKNSHWRNLVRCLLQLSSIVLTSSIATDSALANPLGSLPVPQPESPTPPKPLIRLPQTSQPSPLPTPTPPEALPSPAFSLSTGDKGDRGDRGDEEGREDEGGRLPCIHKSFSPPKSPNSGGLWHSDSPQTWGARGAKYSMQEVEQEICIYGRGDAERSPGVIPSPASPTARYLEESGTTPDTITVEEFEFVVNHPVFTPAELKSFTKGYLNKALSKAQLLSVAAEITKQYAARGYSTSSAVVCIPKTQQPGKRTAIIRVIEGELERIDVKSPPANKEHTEGSLVRLNPNYVRSRFALAASKPLNINKLQEALQLLQKDPLIESASFRLLPGSSPSQSILEVEVKEAKSFSTSLSNNISGFSSLGTSQQQIVLSEANLLGIGDSLSVGYIDTEITHDWNLSYTLPLNAHNGTLSFTYNQSQTYGIPELNGSVPVEAQSASEAASLERSTLSSPFDSLHASGNLSNYGLALRSYELMLRQPVIRRIRGGNAGKGEQPTYEEFALGLTAYLGESSTTLSKVPSPFSSWPNDNGLTRTYALRFFQEWKKENAQDSIQLRSQFSVGLNAFGSTANEPLAQVNPTPATTFFSWQGEAQWTRVLAQDTLLLVRANAQLANQTLVPSEQFALGGKGGYLQHSLLTDNGIFASAEVQLPVLRVFRGKGVIQVIPFVDFGTAWNSSGQANPSPNTLASVGLGLQWQQENFTARLDWGIPLVSVDSPYGTGQENSLYFSVQYHP